MSPLVILSAGGIFMLMLTASGLMMMRQSHQHERFAARVRLIHGQAPAARQPGELGCNQYCLDASRRRSGPDDPAHRSAVGAYACRSREHAGGFGPARGEWPRGLHRLQDHDGRRPAVAVLGAAAQCWPSRHGGDAAAAGQRHTRLACAGLGTRPQAQEISGAPRSGSAGRARHDGDLRPGRARPGPHHRARGERTAELPIGRLPRNWRRRPTSCRWSPTAGLP